MTIKFPYINSMTAIAAPGIGRAARALVSILMACLAAGTLAIAAPQVSSTTTDAGNIYISGSDIRITEPVQGDLFAAGRRVDVEQAVDADGAIAGDTIDIKADIGEDLRSAARSINLDGSIGGDLLAAGATIKVAKSSTVSGPAFMAGGEVIIDGRLMKGAKVYARKIVISGEIDGNARLYGQEIILAKGAKIDGDLIYASENPLPPEQSAQVTGKVVREKTPESWKPASRKPTRAAIWFHPAFFLSMLACGSLLYLIFPNAVNGARMTIRRLPVRSLLIGLALLFTVPPVALLFMITLIGIPIGLGLAALYPVLLLLGYLGTAFFVGREVANALHQPEHFSIGRQIAFLAAALLILGVAAMIPVLGALLIFLALVIGIGGWAVWLYQRYRGDSHQEAAYVSGR